MNDLNKCLELSDTPTGQTLVFAASGEELARLLTWADSYLAAQHIPQDVRQRVFIVLEEIFLNSVNYGQMIHHACDPIQITLIPEANQVVRVVYRDKGVPFDPVAAVSVPEDDEQWCETMQVGGVGLWLLQHFCPDSHYTRDGDSNCLRFSVGACCEN
jgi:serine/threonine-protein kinase RsbW